MRCACPYSDDDRQIAAGPSTCRRQTLRHAANSDSPLLETFTDNSSTLNTYVFLAGRIGRRVVELRRS